MLQRPLLLLIAAGAIVAGSAVACSDDDPEDPTTTATPTVTATLPAGDDDNAAGGTFPAGTEAITVSEALAAGEGSLLVEGFLVITPDGARLCEALAESFPPQCGGASLTLDEPDPSALEQTTSEGDVTWTDQPVQMLGTISGGSMAVQPLAAS